MTVALNVHHIGCYFRLLDFLLSQYYGQGELGLQAKVARLTAEVQGKDLQMPQNVQTNAPALAANETEVYRARMSDLASKNAILREQLSQRRQELVELENKRRRMQELSAILNKEISLTAPMVKEGVVSEVELLRLQREAARVNTELDAATLAIPRARSAIEEVKQKTQGVDKQFRSEAATELSVAKNELAKISESVPGLKDKMARTQVRSPARGIVKTISSRTPGGVVQPGTPLAEVVTVEDTLLVEARIRPQDIAFISIGQPATVKLAAYDFSIYGGLQGKVAYISADSVQPAQAAQGVEATEPYYIAHVSLNQAGILYRDKLLPIIPGMTGQVDILTGKRSVLYYVLKPVNKARQRALTER